jgi:16S rRNA (cytosine967-C5)-methyltransferase
MTPGARAQAAIAVLDAWISGAPAEQALTNWARGARYAGSGDRRAVRDLVYDALRARQSCAALGQAETGRGLIIGLLRLQGLDPATLFTGEGHAPAPLSAHEAARPMTSTERLPDVPDWTLPLLAERAGADLPALLESFRQRAPLFLRVNLRKASRAQAIARLAAEGIVAVPDPRAATALEVTSGARRVKSSDVFADGWVEPQDLSVQIALAAIDWPEGRVLDYCAGGGGKALAIADACDARIIAHDAAPRRMVDLPVRAARAGVAIEIADRAALADAGPFDAVLCDVPCSGSGTWRRDPEAKWRLTPERLADLERTQAEILTDAMRRVVPGGLLVYMTCSLFAAENEAQIARFLSAHPDWRLERQGAETPLSASDGVFHAALRAPGLRPGRGGPAED